jgi:hypothetical protein
MLGIPAAREKVLAGSVITFSFLSDEIDGLVEGEYAFPGWPSLPGFKAIDIQVRGVWTALQVTTVTTVPTLSIGNNDDADNMLPATDKLPTDQAGATAIKTPGGGTFLGDAPTIAVTDKLPDLTTPPRVLVSEAATGVGFTQAKFRLLVTGSMAKLPTIDLG